MEPNGRPSVSLAEVEVQHLFFTFAHSFGDHLVTDINARKEAKRTGRREDIRNENRVGHRKSTTTV